MDCGEASGGSPHKKRLSASVRAVGVLFSRSGRSKERGWQWSRYNTRLYFLVGQTVRRAIAFAVGCALSYPLKQWRVYGIIALVQ